MSNINFIFTDFCIMNTSVSFLIITLINHIIIGGQIKGPPDEEIRPHVRSMTEKTNKQNLAYLSTGSKRLAQAKEDIPRCGWYQVGMIYDDKIKTLLDIGTL